MLFKLFVVALLAFMVYNLFRALIIMNKGPAKQNDSDKNKQVPMSTFIGRRLMFSVALVLILLIGLLTGLITPNPRPY